MTKTGDLANVWYDGRQFLLFYDMYGTAWFWFAICTEPQYRKAHIVYYQRIWQLVYAMGAMIWHHIGGFVTIGRCTMAVHITVAYTCCIVC